MDFNCIYHLIAYRKDKPDILVKEALDLLLSVGKTPEQARDTLTGILSVGGGGQLADCLPYLEAYEIELPEEPVRRKCPSIKRALKNAGITLSCCDCRQHANFDRLHISVSDDILLFRCCVLDGRFLFVDTLGAGGWTAARIRKLRANGMFKAPVLLYRTDTLSLSYPVYACAYEHLQNVPRFMFDRRHENGTALNEDTYRKTIDRVCGTVDSVFQEQPEEVRTVIRQRIRDMLLPLSDIKEYPGQQAVEQALLACESPEEEKEYCLTGTCRFLRSPPKTKNIKNCCQETKEGDIDEYNGNIDVAFISQR